MLFDTHTHLCEDKYDKDREQMIADLAWNNVGGIVEVGDGMRESAQAVDLAKRYEFIYASVGVHPYRAREFTLQDVSVLRDLAIGPPRQATPATPPEEGNFRRNKKVVAIGECGLDYHAGHEAYKEAQKKCFEMQIDLAIELGLPLIVHVRDAYKDCLEILRGKYGDEEEKKLLDGLPRERNMVLRGSTNPARNDETTPQATASRAPTKTDGVGRGIIHCFSGDRAFMEEVCAMGFYVAFGGAMTYGNGGNIREAAKYAPIDRILIETDCPYLVPSGISASRNEPKYVAKTAEVLAEVRGISVGEIEDITWGNAHRVFEI